MKTPTTKDEALLLLKCLHEDFDALMDGTWMPDEDSCVASMELVAALTRYVIKLTGVNK